MAKVARIKLIGHNIDKINDYVNEVKEVSEKLGVSMRGPISLPTKKLALKTRKTPDGEGKASWDRYQFRVHKRLIEVSLNDRALRMIMKIKIGRGLNLQFKLI